LAECGKFNFLAIVFPSPTWEQEQTGRNASLSFAFDWLFLVPKFNWGTILPGKLGFPKATVAEDQAQLAKANCQKPIAQF